MFLSLEKWNNFVLFRCYYLFVKAFLDGQLTIAQGNDSLRAAPPISTSNKKKTCTNRRLCLHVTCSASSPEHRIFAGARAIYHARTRGPTASSCGSSQCQLPGRDRKTATDRSRSVHLNPGKAATNT